MGRFSLPINVHNFVANETKGIEVSLSFTWYVMAWREWIEAVECIVTEYMIFTVM